MAGDNGERVKGERRHFAALFDGAAPAQEGDAFRPADATEEWAGPAPPRRRRWLSAWREAGIRFQDGVRSALAAEWERGTAFLFLPVFLSAGALVYFQLRVEPGLAPLLCSAAALAAAIVLARDRLVARLALIAALLVVAGLLAGKVETRLAGTKMLGAGISTRILGRVVAVEHQPSGRIRLTIDLLKTEGPKLRYAPDRIRVTARAVPKGLEPGEGVEGVVRLLPPSGPLRPSGYDFSFRSYFAGIGASGFFLTNPRIAAAPASHSFRQYLSAALERLRASLSDHVRRAIPGTNGEIATAMLTGDESGIPDDVQEAFRITGLAHVLSISGLHMALVAGIVIVSLRLVFALFPDFSSRRPIRKYAAGVALAAVTFYLLISGAAVATQRSFLMLSVMLVAAMCDRAAITMRNFALAALVVVVTAPHEVTGPSFQMSFAATAALIGAYGAWNEWRQSRPARGPPPARSHLRTGAGGVLRHVAGLAFTSLVAGTATALFAAWHFQRVSPLGLVANLAAMPVISALVMPAMVLAVVLMPFGLDGPAFALMGKGVGLFVAVATALSKHSPFDAVGIVPGAAVAVLTSALVVLTLLTTRLRLLALPLLAVGLVLLARGPKPDVFISEDGRLVALRLSDGRLAVNRRRPNAFTMNDWTRAMMARSVATPAADAATAMPTAAPEVPFSCTRTLCIAWNRAGAVVAHAANAGAVTGDACAVADLIVIDDATAHDPCPGRRPLVITKRDLALRGAAAVTFEPHGAALVPHVVYSIGRPYRAWHAARAYSRAARGLPPYKRKEHHRPSAKDDRAARSSSGRTGDRAAKGAAGPQ